MAINPLISKSDLPFLTIRQQKMLNGYLRHGNATQAYKDAGYHSVKHADKAAHNIIHRSPMVEHVEFHLARTKSLVGYDWIVDRLKQIIDDTVSDSPLQSRDTAIKALAELNKMQGNYAPVQTNVQNVNIQTTLDDIRSARLEYKKEY